jgi:hypothetical protein
VGPRAVERRKSLALGRPARSLVTVPPELSRLPAALIIVLIIIMRHGNILIPRT